MEEHALALQLQHSRQQLRSMLVPEDVAGNDEYGEFPRSAVMQFLLDPARGKLAFTVLCSLLMLAARRRLLPGAAWPDAVQMLRALLGAPRNP